MVLTAATITGKVLIQIGDDEPVEVGTVEIPILVGADDGDLDDDGEGEET